MFPNGVIYEGVGDKPHYYRGESGANDSIIPTLDNFLQLTEKMPSNPLTEILKDFRSYRPSQHNEYLTSIQKRSFDLKIFEFALQDAKSACKAFLITLF
jgi:indoleamine 2,3-dioxygenase